MKKIIYLFVLSLVLVGCGSSASGGNSNVSMDSITKALESSGAVLESDKPMFSLIGAKDGLMFYSDGKPVKVYEFESEKEIKKAEKALPGIKDWGRNGLFVLETSHDESKEVFKSVK